MSRIATAAACAILFVSSAANAQPGPPTPAPMPVESSERPRGTLSHINGAPVPVGDHNQYYYEFPKTNLAINPLGWIVGFYGVSASAAIHEHVAIRGDVTYYNIVDSDETGLELDLSAPIYFRRVYSGVFLEPGVMFRRFEDDERPTLGPQVLIGWHWIWDSGLNVAAAIGGGRDISGARELGDEEVFFNGYMRFGYAF